jgi:hypothetical protein
VSVFGFKSSQAGVEQFPLGDEDNVKPSGNLVATENLSNQSFSSIPLHCPAQFSRGGYSEPSGCEAVGQDEEGAVAAVNLIAPLVNALEISRPANPFMARETRHCRFDYSLLTVKRLRPFARRRFRTKRPFLVLIRTRNPCVRLRRRVFGWNVRFPFIVNSGSG